MKVKRSVLLYFGVAITVAITAGIVLRVGGQGSPPCLPSYVPRLQAGVGSQAPCPSSLQNITPSISNAAFFMYYRSDVTLSSAVQQRLAQLEQESWPGQSNGEVRLTRAQMESIVASALLAVMPSVTDAQLNSWSTNSFQVIPGWTASNRNSDVQLDPSSLQIDRTTFVQSAQQLRSGSSDMQTQVTTAITNMLEKHCNVLAYAIPSTWNVTYYSPYRVFMVAYSLVTSDRLADSYSDCMTHMQQVESWLGSQGISCPSAGRCLWGNAGYMYNRPVNTFFSDTVQMDLLNRYAAVHGLQ